MTAAEREPLTLPVRRYRTRSLHLGKIPRDAGCGLEHNQHMNIETLTEGGFQPYKPPALLRR